MSYNRIPEPSFPDYKAPPMEFAAGMEPDEQVKQLVLDLTGGRQPEAIFSFSSGIIEDPSTGKYRTLRDYTELNEHGFTSGSSFRRAATVDLARVFPYIPIFTTSYNRFNPDEPSMASVVARELTEGGVDSTRIIREERSFSTITEIIEMVNEAGAHGIETAVVVTDDWHLPRKSRMYNHLGDLVSYEDPEADAAFRRSLDCHEQVGSVSGFVACQNILRITDPEFGPYMDHVETTDLFAANIAGEMRGVAALDEGRYRVTLQAENPRT